MLMGWRLKIATLGVVSASTMQCRNRALLTAAGRDLTMRLNCPAWEIW
jgi:hypothetical protein